MADKAAAAAGMAVVEPDTVAAAVAEASDTEVPDTAVVAVQAAGTVVVQAGNLENY